MRGKGINYDTGFYLDPQGSRPDFSADIDATEMRVIATELGCTAVRVSGGDPERLSVAAEAAAAAGLEVWFAPFPMDLPAGQTASLLADCADRAEHLRRTVTRAPELRAPPPASRSTGAPRLLPRLVLLCGNSTMSRFIEPTSD